MPPKKLSLNNLIPRLAWHNHAMPFVLTVDSNPEEFSLLCELAHVYPDPRTTTALAKAVKVVPETVSKIASRFPQLIDAERRGPADSLYRLLLPADVPMLRTRVPLWVSDPATRKYHDEMREILCRWNLHCLPALILRVLLYHAVNRRARFSRGELALLTHAASDSVIQNAIAALHAGQQAGVQPKRSVWADQLDHNPCLTWARDGLRTVMFVLPRSAEGFTPEEARPAGPRHQTKNVRPRVHDVLLKYKKSMSAEEIAALLVPPDATIQAVRQALLQLEKSGIAIAARKKGPGLFRKTVWKLANNSKRKGRPHNVTEEKERQDRHGAASLKPRAWCQVRDRIGIPPTPTVARFGSWTAAYDSAESDIRDYINIQKSKKKAAYKSSVAA